MPSAKTITAYKALNSDFTCRGFQFEVGKTYSVKGAIKPCQNGFHACQFPLDCFDYYAPGNGLRFAEVELSGTQITQGDKIAARKIAIKAELTLPEFINRAVDLIVTQAIESKETNTGGRSAATNTGNQSAARVEGRHSVAHADGYAGIAAASKGSAFTLVERDDSGAILHVFAAIAGRDGIKPDTYYTLENGQPVEA